MTVIECCQQFLLSHHENAFSNPTRNQHCAGRLNSLLGFPKSRALFEYYDIILSRNMILGKHGDEKNDHRTGYNHCVVYSFYCEIDDLEYKVSIVMTTRSAIGCPMDRVSKILEK